MIPTRLTALLRTIRQLGPVGPAMIATAGLPILGVAILAVPLANTAPMVREAGLAGAAAFAVGAGALAGLSVIPMHLLAILAGWTFAAATGIPTVFAGLLAAAAIGYFASAALAKRRVVELIGTHPSGAVLHRALVARSLARTAFVVALLRLSPVMPFAATNLAMASVGVPFGAFLLGTVAGMLPRVIAGVLVGVGLAEFDPANPTDSWQLVAGIAATVLVVGVIARIARRALTSPSSAPATPRTSSPSR